jgi:hypothetical protein
MMDSASINGVHLDYTDQGVGELVLCIHGALVPDAFVPLFREPVLASVPPLLQEVCPPCAHGHSPQTTPPASASRC